MGHRHLPTKSHSESLKRSFTQFDVKGSSISEEAEDSSPEEDVVEEPELRSITTSG